MEKCRGKSRLIRSHSVDEGSPTHPMSHQAVVFRDAYPATATTCDNQSRCSTEREATKTDAIDLALSLGSFNSQHSFFVHRVKQDDIVETSSEQSRSVVERSAGSITEEKGNSLTEAGSSTHVVTFSSGLGEDLNCVSPDSSFGGNADVPDLDVPTTVGGNFLLRSGEEKIFLCRFCDRRFHSSQALGGHQNAHKRERLAGRKGPTLALPYFAHGYSAVQGSARLISELPNSSNRSLGIKAHSSIHKPATSSWDPTFRGDVSLAPQGWSRAFIGQQRPGVVKCLLGDIHSKSMAGGVARFEGAVGFGGKLSGPVGFPDEESSSNWAGKSSNWKHFTTTNVSSSASLRPTVRASEQPSLLTEELPIVDLSLRL